MPSSVERKAIALNGLIIVGGCVLGALEATRPWGIGLTMFMGVGLIFSGWANFCGWYKILGPRESNQTGQTTFWVGGRDAHRKGLNDHYKSQMNEATRLASESDTEAGKIQHLEDAGRLRKDFHSKLEDAKHAVY